MQVNSISSVNQAHPAFKSFESDIETLARLDDKSIRQIAYAKASNDVNDKKHRRITNALYYSIPLAAGVAAAVKKPNILSSVVKQAKSVNLSRFTRLNNFASTAIGWATTFLAVDGIFATKRYMDKKVPDMKEFSKEHPVMSTLGTIGVAIAAIAGVNKGLSKLSSKLISKIPAKKLDKTTLNVAKKLNNSKVLNKISKGLSKVPSSIKNLAAGALDYAPLLLIVSSIAHSFGHERVKAAEYQNNYNDIKSAQALVRQGIAMKEAMEEE